MEAFLFWFTIVSMNDQKRQRPCKPDALHTFTLKKLDESIENRVQLIEREVKDGLNLIKKYTKTVTFFGSARTMEDEADYINARALAGRISAELGYTIVTGGNLGIMEAANRGAIEAGGTSLGLTINLPFEHNPNKYLTEQIDFHYFFTRKLCLSFSAETYIYFPGGFGTFDELFEILTLIQTKKIPQVPIILFGSAFWNPLQQFIRDYMITNEKINPEDLNLYVITDDMDLVIDTIRKTPVKIGA